MSISREDLLHDKLFRKIGDLSSSQIVTFRDFINLVVC
jgi:hypothetical protein